MWITDKKSARKSEQICVMIIGASCIVTVHHGQQFWSQPSVLEIYRMPMPTEYQSEKIDR